MGQPTPPGDMPLIEGLGPEWNDIVSAIPEAQRAELAPRLRERISSYEPLKQWEDLQKSGITPEHADTALRLFSTIENNPQEVYEMLGKHLGISTAEAQQVVEAVEEGDEDDPRIRAMQQQIDTLSQIAIASRQQSTQERLAEEQDAALQAEIDGLKKKYGDDFHEDEIVMRMLQLDMTAEQAYQDYSKRVSEIRARRPSPMIMSGGGAVPPKRIDPSKLSNPETKNLVTQMLIHAKNEANS